MSQDYNAALVIGYLFCAIDMFEHLEVHVPEESHVAVRYGELTGQARNVVIVTQKEGVRWKHGEVLYDKDFQGLIALTEALTDELGCFVTPHSCDSEDIECALVSFSLTTKQMNIDVSSGDGQLQRVVRAYDKVVALGKRLQKLGFPIAPVKDAGVHAVLECY